MDAEMSELLEQAAQMKFGSEWRLVIDAQGGWGSWVRRVQALLQPGRCNHPRCKNGYHYDEAGCYPNPCPNHQSIFNAEWIKVATDSRLPEGCIGMVQDDGTVKVIHLDTQKEVGTLPPKATEGRA